MLNNSQSKLIKLHAHVQTFPKKMYVMNPNFVNGLMVHVKNSIVQMQLIKNGVIE